MGDIKSVKKRMIFAAVAAALMLLISSICLAITAQTPLPVFAARKIPIYRVNTQNNFVSLTFDAAWGADKTQGILDILDEYEIKCTFFLVSFWMEAHPDMVREIALRGHEIGTHSATHPDMTKLSEKQIQQELLGSIKIIEDLTGRKVTLFRAPFGAYDNKLLTVTEELKLFTIQWDVDSLDWKGLSAKEIASRIQKAKKGSIILCHNNSDNILAALHLIIESVRVKGLSFVPVGQLIYASNYYIDGAGEQHSTNQKN